MKKLKLLSTLLVLGALVSCNKHNPPVDSESSSNNPSVSVTASSTSVDNDDVFTIAFNNDYSNVTYCEDYSMTSTIEDYSNMTVKFEQEITSSAYKMSFTQDGKNVTFFVEETAEGMKLYTKNSEGTWIFKIVSKSDWNSAEYSEYYTTMRDPSTFAFDSSSFTYTDGKYLCKDEFLNEIGLKIMGDGYASSTYSKIEVVLNDDYLSSITLDFSSSGSTGKMDSTLKLSYSKINSTVVTLPEASEVSFNLDCIDPNSAMPLTNQQEVVLNNALKNTYSSYSCTYSSTDSNEMNSIYEKSIYQNGKFDIYQEVSQYGGFHVYQSQYYLEIAKSKVIYYEVDANNMVISAPVTSENESEFTPYAMDPTSFPFEVTDFGYAEGTYVCTPTALDKLTKQSNMTDGKIASIEIKTDINDNIKDVRIIYTFNATSNYDAYSQTESFAYSNINKSNVTLPVAGQPAAHIATADELIKFNLAASYDMSNVTVMDSFSTTVYLYANQKVQHIGVDENGSTYLQSFTHEADGKYYVSNEYGLKEEIPGKTIINSDGSYTYGYDYYIPTLNFAALDASKIYYNSFTKNYEVQIEDIDLSAFAFYFSLGFEEYNFSRIIFTINEDNNFDSVEFYYIDSETNTEYIGKGLFFSKYDKTTTI